MSIPLAVLFARSLSTVSKSLTLPNIEEETQELVQSSLQDLYTLQSRITGLSLFSRNETVEDISTRDLLYLLVPFVLSEVQGRVRTTEREDRLSSLNKSEQYFKSFLSLVDNYQIVPQDEIELHERKLSSIGNPAARREFKLKQYQKEKDLRVRIEVVRKRRNQPQQSEISNDFDLIASLLPSPNSSKAIIDDDDDDDESDQVLREATLLLIRLGCAQAHTQLQNMEQELELLRVAPPRLLPPRSSEYLKDGHKDRQNESDRDMWKLDLPSDGGPDGKGPLTDPLGKPLRAFTILPSDSASRARIHAQVFRPGHNLPTMTIDEYLEIERQRGQVISGGGPASEAALTTSEQLALDSEMDGTQDAEDKSEAKRQKDERWAVFTDDNPRGTGNTMNRG